MSYTIDATVTIDGVDYTADTVDRLVVRRGRDEFYQTMPPGAATVQLIDKTGTGIPLEVTKPISIKLKNSAGVDVTLFTGRISDWSTSVYDAGIKNTAAAIYQITATGPLARLNRRTVLASGRPEEKDGTRIEAILGEAFATPWEDASGTWNEAENTWEAYEPEVDPALVDTPGVYDIIALAASDGVNALSHAAAVASSAAGVLYETGEGRIGYADALRRPQNAADGYLNVPATVIDAGSVSTVQRDADIVNTVTVNYGVAASVQESDTASVAQYGENARVFSTLLANLSDAQLRAADIVDTQAFPTVNFERFGVILHGDINDSLRDALIAAEINDAILVQNMPATLGRTNLAGFVEGLTYTVTPFEAGVSVALSDAPLSIGTAAWNQLPLLAWENVAPSIQWADARSIV